MIISPLPAGAGAASRTPEVGEGDPSEAARGWGHRGTVAADERSLGFVKVSGAGAYPALSGPATGSSMGIGAASVALHNFWRRIVLDTGLDLNYRGSGEEDLDSRLTVTYPLLRGPLQINIGGAFTSLPAEVEGMDVRAFLTFSSAF